MHSPNKDCLQPSPCLTEPIEYNYHAFHAYWIKIPSVSLSQAEHNRKKEYQAAVRIQSWFRGCKVRTDLRYSVDKLLVKQK